GYLGGSLTSETVQPGSGATTTNTPPNNLLATLATRSNVQNNYDNSLLHLALNYTYIFSGIPIGLGIGIEPMVGGSVKQGTRDVLSDSSGINLNAEYVSLNVNSSFTGNASTAALGIPSGTQVNRNWNGGHFIVNLGVGTKF